MKITRSKKLQKSINFYINNFGYHEPFQILIDATFCQIAFKNKVNIREQLPRYFQSELKLVTTSCIIIEADKLGPKVAKAALIVKQFAIHKCGHEGNPISGSACFKEMSKQTRYVIATQDRELQQWLRKRPGQPLMYLHKVAPVLEPPSLASKTLATRKCEEKVSINENEDKKLNHFKEKLGIKEEIKIKILKKKIKNPNPLSCKKKKKKTGNILHVGKQNNILNSGIQKKKRKKNKIPNHVKEELSKIKN